MTEVICTRRVKSVREASLWVKKYHTIPCTAGHLARIYRPNRREHEISFMLSAHGRLTWMYWPGHQWEVAMLWAECERAEDERVEIIAKDIWKGPSHLWRPAELEELRVRVDLLKTGSMPQNEE